MERSGSYLRTGAMTMPSTTTDAGTETPQPGLPGLLEQVTPQLRRLERARFASLAGRGSVADHDRIIALCADRRADDAARATHENWSTLGRLLHLDDEDPSPTAPTEGTPWPSPTSPASS